MDKNHLAMFTKFAALQSAAIATHAVRRGSGVPVRFRNHHYGVNAWREHNTRPPS
jgi:Ni/Co efflux regulator RcnB